MTLKISQYFEQLSKEIEIPPNDEISSLENKVNQLENKLKEMKDLNSKKSGKSGVPSGSQSATGKNNNAEIEKKFFY